MFSKKPQIHIDKVENLDIHSHLHPFVEELLVELVRKSKRVASLADERWPIMTQPEPEPEPSQFASILNTIGKIVSIISAVAIIVFVVLLLLGQTLLGSVNIGNLLTVVSVTLVGGLVSIGGVRIFSFQASLRRMQQVVRAQAGCPYVPIREGSHRRNNGEYRPGNPQFCVKCPLGIDTTSEELGLIHNCSVYPQLHREWLATR